jgi:hypothetical protein
MMSFDQTQRFAAKLDATMGADLDRPFSADDEQDNHRNAPQPDPACLYGLIGDIARTGSATTEANPYAIALNAIAYLSCAVGRGPYGSFWPRAQG